MKLIIWQANYPLKKLTIKPNTPKPDSSMLGNLMKKYDTKHAF
jgi:hypothetical protein